MPIAAWIALAGLFVTVSAYGATFAYFLGRQSERIATLEREAIQPVETIYSIGNANAGAPAKELLISKGVNVGVGSPAGEPVLAERLENFCAFVARSEFVGKRRKLAKTQ